MNTILKFTVLLLLLTSPQTGNAWNWSPVGPDTEILNFHTGAGAYCEVLCSTDGLIVYEYGDWQTYSYGGLPVLDVAGLDDQRLLLVQGDGSYSDGIYTFNRETHQFDMVHFCLYPRFIEQDMVTHAYVAGYEEGLLVSPDGITWTAVPYFDGLTCSDIARWGTHVVVCGISGIHSSPDGGLTWESASPAAPWIEDIAFDYNGKLYGIFPDESWSSGLWSSTDFGLNWWVEFWSIDMSDVYCVDGEVYVSWLEPWVDYFGIAHWDPDVQVLTFMNEGLPDAGINELSENTIIDCYNIVCCTQSGAWMTCDVMGISMQVAISYAEGYVYLSWNPFPGAISYNVYSSSEPGSGFTLNVGGTHLPNGWFEEVGDEKKFYYVTAVLE